MFKFSNEYTEVALISLLLRWICFPCYHYVTEVELILWNQKFIRKSEITPMAGQHFYYYFLE